MAGTPQPLRRRDHDGRLQLRSRRAGCSATGGCCPIAEYEVLFNLIGTTYGGDGQQTFALPDLRGRVPVHRARAPA